MIRPNLKKYTGEETFLRNVLYRIDVPDEVCFTERHADKTERVKIEYSLEKGQYGIYAQEFRNPIAGKQECKTSDVLACIVDEECKKILTVIFDVKSNISAFSDDLLKDGAMLTVIKEVRDFTKQLHDEILHKESFMLYYKDEGFEEREILGLATGNFESGKFIKAADLLELLFEHTDSSVPRLVQLKLKKNLMAYRNESIRLRDFAEKRVNIGEKTYDLQVFLLEKISDTECEATVKMALNTAYEAAVEMARNMA